MYSTQHVYSRERKKKKFEICIRFKNSIAGNHNTHRGHLKAAQNQEADGSAAGGGGRQMYLLIGRKACRQGDACGKPSPNESEPVNMETVIFIVQYMMRVHWTYTGSS